jgi:hypothetical protein
MLTGRSSRRSGKAALRSRPFAVTAASSVSRARRRTIEQRGAVRLDPSRTSGQAEAEEPSRRRRATSRTRLMLFSQVGTPTFRSPSSWARFRSSRVASGKRPFRAYSGWCPQSAALQLISPQARWSLRPVFEPKRMGEGPQRTRLIAVPAQRVRVTSKKRVQFFGSLDLRKARVLAIRVDRPLRNCVTAHEVSSDCVQRRNIDRFASTTKQLHS